MRTDDPLVSLSLDTFLSILVRPSIASKTLHTVTCKESFQIVVIDRKLISRSISVPYTYSQNSIFFFEVRFCQDQ